MKYTADDTVFQDEEDHSYVFIWGPGGGGDGCVAVYYGLDGGYAPTERELLEGARKFAEAASRGTEE